MAEDEGFEPSTTVLETAVLPIETNPLLFIILIIPYISEFVNRYYSIPNTSFAIGLIALNKATDGNVPPMG